MRLRDEGCMSTRWVALIALLAARVGQTWGADLLGLYVGGAAGRGDVVVNGPYSVFWASGKFSEPSTTYKAMLGVHPIALLGAEIAYIDFGNASGFISYQPTSVALRARAAFGVLHLPTPVIDLYGKVGLAHLDARLTNNGVLPLGYGTCAIGVTCAPLANRRFDRGSTNVAFGAGAQYELVSSHTLGALALRVEYEQFQFAGENPNLASVGVIWTFL
jgi:hypothetical protein